MAGIGVEHVMPFSAASVNFALVAGSGCALEGRTAVFSFSNAPHGSRLNVIFGGLKTSVTTGYGPARYFDSKLVAESATALVSADRKVIAGRYDPAEMKKLDLYAPTEERERKAILNVAEEFTAFFQKAASANEDVITYVS